MPALAPLGMQIVGRDAYTWHCGCDSQSMARALAGMEPQKLQELGDEHGMITVSCRYCGSSHSIKPGKIA